MPNQSPLFEITPIPADQIVLSVAEAERIAGISHTTLFKWLNDGRVRSKKIGRRRVIERASLVEFLTGRDDAA
jgi:excisionase family DNA binding protein